MRCGLSALVILLSVAASAYAQAQARVRVIRDGAIIWRRDARVPATTLKAGTVLEVLGREGDWYVVLIPIESGGKGETGNIAVSQVEPDAGSAPLPVAPPRETTQRPGAAAARRAPIRHRPLEVFGFGQAGLNTWLAHDTFDAVLGSANAPIFGGGAQVRIKGRLFVEAAVERFEKTGERVFVSDGEVFKLGIRDTVRVVPVFFTAGYRHDTRQASAYVGGGVGRYFYRETADFANPGDDVDESFSSYHALAGVEFGGAGWLRTAFEVQFTTVPDALGATGASAAFGESNLGGLQIRIKILAGR